MAAFELLMRQHERLVLVTALRLAGNLPDAQDVSQEVFLKLYRNLGKLTSEEAIASWLYRVTVNACHDLRRRRRPENPMENAGQLASAGADPHQALTEIERSRALELSLRLLPEKERAALVLRDLEGLSTRGGGARAGVERGYGALADFQGAGQGEGICGAVFREAVMNCVEWEARVALHAGGDLAGAEATAVERHLGECSACQVLWSGVRESLAVLQAAHAELPAAADFTAVRSRVMSELERRARPWRSLAWISGVAAAAVLLVLAFWPARGWFPRLRACWRGFPRRAEVRVPVRQVAAHVARAKRRAPLTVKWQTADPKIVIYWIAD